MLTHLCKNVYFLAMAPNEPIFFFNKNIDIIGLDKDGYQVNIFLISPWKHIVGTL